MGRIRQEYAVLGLGAEVEWAEPVWLSRYRSRLSRAVTGSGWLLLIETQA